MSDPLFPERPVRDGPSLGGRELVVLATLLERYERAEPASAGQLAAFVALREAFPHVDMPTRLEPRSPVVGRLAEEALRDGSGLAREVHAAVSLGDMGAEPLATLLSLLADARVTVDTATLSDLVDRLASLPPGVLADDAHSALISLAGRRPLTVISLLERLQALPIPRPTAAFGALQSVASDSPDHLGAALSIAARTLRGDALDASALSYVLRDLCHRAGPYVVLVAMAEQDPAAASRLLASAFSGDDAPFGLQQRSFEDEERQCLEVSFGGEVVPLSGRGLGRPVQPWLAAVRKALRSAAAEAATRAAEAAAGSGARGRAALAFASLRTRVRISDAALAPAAWTGLIGAVDRFSRRVA